MILSLLLLKLNVSQLRDKTKSRKSYPILPKTENRQSSKLYMEVRFGQPSFHKLKMYLEMWK